MDTRHWKVFEGQTVDGKYRLQRLLGNGAFGGVPLCPSPFRPPGPPVRKGENRGGGSLRPAQAPIAVKLVVALAAASAQIAATEESPWLKAA